MQSKRSQAHDERLAKSGELYEEVEGRPPKFAEDTIFHPKVELYATTCTTEGSADLKMLSQVTEKEKLFMPCMVGQLEGQFLKMMAQLTGAKRILDVGTFTGYSALSFAEALPSDGKVVTIENDPKIAAVAEKIFKQSSNAEKLDLVVGSAPEEMKKMLARGETFDIVFIDADKENYIEYYELAMQGLLTNGSGVIMADNSMCALVYREGDMRRDRLHKFNGHVARDQRVEQVVLTVREGVTLIRPTASYWTSRAEICGAKRA